MKWNPLSLFRRNPDIYSRFKKWVNNQSGGYRYQNSIGCAFGIFLAKVEKAPCPWVTIGGYTTDLSDPSKQQTFPSNVMHALAEEPHTYEALAKRLEAI
jgi:hypothetical protein